MIPFIYLTFYLTAIVNTPGASLVVLYTLTIPDLIVKLSNSLMFIARNLDKSKVPLYDSL